MAKLIMVRHGESCWNKANVFTGWVDIPLSQKGIEEALQCGEMIKDIPIDVIFTSTLIRAQMTAFLSMTVHRSNKIPLVQHLGEDLQSQWSTIYNEEIKNECIPLFYSWELNERMYGELQGQNKETIAKKYGMEKFKTWRRSYDTPPPQGESLEMTAARALPYFKETIIPYLHQGKNVYICAHGNSIRAICMHLDQLTKEQVVNLEIATGVPMVYNYCNGKLIKE